jgi:hypothetical protein
VVFPGIPDAPLGLNPFLTPTFAGTPQVSRGRGRTQVVVPYAYPVYVGGYGYGYGYGTDPNAQPAPQPAPTDVYAYPPQQAQPPVIIYQTFVAPGAQPPAEPEPDTGVYQAPSRPSTESAPGAKVPVFLIAYTDHSVYTAVAYWVEDDTLHYITTDGKHNQASLSLIDRKMSEDLNKERDIDFRLPK